MIAQMIRSSLAVVTRPRLETFAEHQRDNLAWGVIYITIAAVVNGLLAGLSTFVRLQLTADQLRLAQEQFEGTPIAGLMALQTNPLAFALLTLVFTPLAFVVSNAVLYGLVRAFGGQATFGQLAYTLSLYTVPIGFGSVLLSVASVGLLACLAAPLTLVIAGYGYYLQYLAIRATSGLPKDRTIGVIVVQTLIGLLVACAVGGLMVAAIMGSMGALR